MTFHPLRIGKRTVGLLDVEAGVYRTFRHHAAHFARRWNGYGIQRAVLVRLKELGVLWVEVDETRASGSVWRMRQPLDLWLTSGHVDTLRDADGEQVFLSVRRLGVGVRVKEAPSRTATLPERRVE